MVANAVIVGAGQAGFQCAASLRDNGWNGGIFLVGAEEEAPYYRPPLSKEYLRGESADDELWFRPESFFQRNAIELVTGAAVRTIDRAARQIRLAFGRNVDYDQLVLATGAAPRVPAIDGIGLGGVVVLRDRRDALALRTLLSRGKSLVIIGGGFIGTEVAAAAQAPGTVTIVESAPRILTRVLSASVARRVQETHESRGVRVLTGSTVTRLRGESGRVRSVELADGRVLDADLVLFSIGAEPRTALAADAGLDVCDGVVVDAALRTADPCISAIGDCANFPTRFGAGRLRLESVQNAADQAKYVAERLVTGTDRPYDSVPWFWTHQHGDKIQIVGVADENDECVVVPGRSADSFSVYRVRGGAAVAVESVNAPRDHIRARKSLAAGPIPLTNIDDGVLVAEGTGLS